MNHARVLLISSLTLSTTTLEARSPDKPLAVVSWLVSEAAFAARVGGAASLADRGGKMLPARRQTLRHGDGRLGPPGVLAGIKVGFIETGHPLPGRDSPNSSGLMNAPYFGIPCQLELNSRGEKLLQPMSLRATAGLPSGAHAARDSDHLPVRVYDSTELRWRVKRAIFSDTERIFRRAGITVVFVSGDPGGPEARLITYPELPRKGRETEAACRAQADVALDLLQRAPEGLRPSILGAAVPYASEGLNVRLFVDRVEAAALSWNRTFTAVAAHVLAHEIGHVLLRTNEHSQHGLMAAVLAGDEYARLAAGLLLFSGVEAETVTSALRRTGCSGSSI